MNAFFHSEAACRWISVCSHLVRKTPCVCVAPGGSAGAASELCVALGKTGTCVFEKVKQSVCVCLNVWRWFSNRNLSDCYCEESEKAKSDARNERKTHFSTLALSHSRKRSKKITVLLHQLTSSSDLYWSDPQLPAHRPQTCAAY